MTTRREFLHASALGITGGVLATPAAAAPAIADQPDAASRGAIIDCHAHWMGPRVVQLAKERGLAAREGGVYDMEYRLQLMDEAGVQRQVVSYVRAAYDGVLAPDEARPLWRAQNDDTAALVRKYPTRYSGLATLPTANVAWAADELRRAHEELGLIGATLPLDAFTSLEGARALSPIFDMAQRLRSYIYVHRGPASPDIPGQHPEVGPTNEYFGLPSSSATDFRVLSTNGDNQGARLHLITATHLATGAITLALTEFLDDYPDVAVQLTMMGGTIGWVAEWMQRIAEESGRPIPAERFRRIYLDCGARARYPRGVAMGAKVFGIDRILFGTDLGAVGAILPTIGFVNEATLTPQEKNRIFVENARELLAGRI